MKRRRRSHRISSNPLEFWTRLALNTSELVIASAEVITHRTNRFAAAGMIPSLRDQREFTLMSQEKIEAVTESAQAIAARAFSLHHEISVITLRQIVAGTNGIMLLATSRTVTQSSQLQVKLVSEALCSSADAATQLADLLAQLAQHGLKPIHARVTANARRLARLSTHPE
ncbi:MAG: polyhydroxyalkanoate granule-associated phasin [Pseudomonadota bacterium]